jgi:hypothetical protein
MRWYARPVTPPLHIPFRKNRYPGVHMCTYTHASLVRRHCTAVMGGGFSNAEAHRQPSLATIRLYRPQILLQGPNESPLLIHQAQHGCKAQ